MQCVCSSCHRDVEAFYLMPDERILCYDCWKFEREREYRLADEVRRFHDQQMHRAKYLKQVGRTEEANEAYHLALSPYPHTQGIQYFIDAKYITKEKAESEMILLKLKRHRRDV